MRQPSLAEGWNGQSRREGLAAGQKEAPAFLGHLPQTLNEQVELELPEVAHPDVHATWILPLPATESPTEPEDPEDFSSSPK